MIASAVATKVKADVMISSLRLTPSARSATRRAADPFETARAYGESSRLATSRSNSRTLKTPLRRASYPCANITPLLESNHSRMAARSSGPYSSNPGTSVSLAIAASHSNT